MPRGLVVLLLFLPALGLLATGCVTKSLVSAWYWTHGTEKFSEGLLSHKSLFVFTSRFTLALGGAEVAVISSVPLIDPRGTEKFEFSEGRLSHKSVVVSRLTLGFALTLGLALLLHGFTLNPVGLALTSLALSVSFLSLESACSLDGGTLYL